MEIKDIPAFQRYLEPVKSPPELYLEAVYSSWFHEHVALTFMYVIFYDFHDFYLLCSDKRLPCLWKRHHDVYLSLDIYSCTFKLPHFKSSMSITSAFLDIHSSSKSFEMSSSSWWRIHAVLLQTVISVGLVCVSTSVSFLTFLESARCEWYLVYI